MIRADGYARSMNKFWGLTGKVISLNREHYYRMEFTEPISGRTRWWVPRDDVVMLYPTDPSWEV